MERYRTFKITYLPCTETKSARISIHDFWHGNRKTIKYSMIESGDSHDRGIAYLESIGIKISGCSQSKPDRGYDCALTTDFETCLK